MEIKEEGTKQITRKAGRTVVDDVTLMNILMILPFKYRIIK